MYMDIVMGQISKYILLELIKLHFTMIVQE